MKSIRVELMILKIDEEIQLKDVFRYQDEDWINLRLYSNTISVECEKFATQKNIEKNKRKFS